MAARAFPVITTSSSARWSQTSTYPVTPMKPAKTSSIMPLIQGSSREKRNRSVNQLRKKCSRITIMNPSAE